MSIEPARPSSPRRWGLAAKLLAILTLLGAVAVLVTGVLGYVRARVALEEAVLEQLTTARVTKARQVETYFRSIRNELRLLAASKMVTDAASSFSAAFAELDGNPPDAGLQKSLDAWYEANIMPGVRRRDGASAKVADYMPQGPAAIWLQHHYIATNPHPVQRRNLVDNPGDGSAWSALHAAYHPLLRSAASLLGFADLLLVDPKSGRVVYATSKEVDFAGSLRSGALRSSNLAAAVARCAAAPDPSVTCLEDFAAYAPSDGAPIAFMAAPVIERGVVVAVLVAQLNDDEIDRVVTGERRWRQEGFGDTGEAYLIGPDLLLRSGGRLFYEDRERYFAELGRSGVPAAEIDAIKRYDSPILHQKIDISAARAALAGLEGTGHVAGTRGMQVLASWGPLMIPGVKWVIVAKIETEEAFAPVRRLERDLMIVGVLAFLVVLASAAWLSRTLLGPLRELTGGVRRFAAGDYDTKVAVRSKDEVGDLVTAFNGMVDELRVKTATIEAKNRENEQLLLNILPGPIANRLRGGEQRIADGFAEVSVLFADIVGFTALSATMPPEKLVGLLNGLFVRFDMSAQELGIEKIKTVGDSYMAVAGLPEPAADHAERLLRMAIRMVHITREHGLDHNTPLHLRIGLNSGPVVAGVIGRSKYIYDLWGDTVNLASRMESSGIPDHIQVTRAVYDRVKDKFAFEARGTIELKGKGQVEAWLLKL
jgi:class 3 adenylate cyclase